ncbi:hypothetical protein P8452_52618 [Trifolium repens]|jgi:hypothetical protein|nr:hypothetical protein P8452_52618 [Trifolium repens]
MFGLAYLSLSTNINTCATALESLPKQLITHSKLVFRDLQLEIARRFNLNDMNNLVLKYLDDEGKRGLYYHVMLILKNVKTCTHLLTRTIRLSLFQASPLNLPNNFRNSSSPSS